MSHGALLAGGKKIFFFYNSWSNGQSLYSKWFPGLCIIMPSTAFISQFVPQEALMFLAIFLSNQYYGSKTQTYNTELQ